MTEKKKGTFGEGLLDVTRKYIFPASRRWPILVGGIACLVVLAYILLDTVLLGNTFIARGRLSSNHANFESDCSRCHTSFEAVNNQKCSTCHEKSNDRLGIYTFAAHYGYRSYDQTRVAMGAKYKRVEESCATCHPDHRGRDGSITDVSDFRCTGCHDYGSFNKNHPEFEFARKQIPDQSTLMFTHIHHTKLVLEQKLNKSVDIVQACLYCHNPEADGKSFKPITFDLHCAGSCHYPVAIETPTLAIRDAAAPEKPGVETLDMIQRGRGLGTRWSFYMNPNEFNTNGGRVVKSPVYHKDPWILENLRSIRHLLYPSLGLTDLLQATGSIDGDDRTVVYREALQTLSEFRAELAIRPEPEVQADLSMLDSLTRVVSQRITDPNTNLMESGFLSPEGNENPTLTGDQRSELERFALRLTRDCQKCHVIAQASIMRIRADQRVLRRAEFNHRAHIIQRPYCLDCHTEIPVEKMLLGDSLQIVSMKQTAAMVDSSKTQNIPHIKNCYECHTSSAAANKCVTCHYMHPNKTNRANLRLFVGNR